MKKEHQQQEMALSVEEIKELGYRLQAVYEMTETINVDGPDRHQDYSIKLLNKEVGDIVAVLMMIDDSESIEYLKK